MEPLHQIPPRTPFATSLSGSARETELRLRSIFQWKKKRPPVLFLLLAALCVLLCSSLVSCQTAEGASASSSPVLAPSGSNVPSYSQLSLLETLFGAVKGQMEADALSEASPSLLHASSREGVTLAAASFQDGSGVYLVVAAVAQDTGALTGSPYILSGQDALPQVLAYEPYGQEGDFHLLYTFNSMSQGLLYGSAGVVRLSQGRLSWVWPVEGDILVQGSQAQSDYYAYWAYRLALMAPGGVDVFLLADDQGGGEGPQWLPDHNELFYPAGEEQLTTGIYYQFRV